MSWTLAPGWCSNVIAVATSPQTGSDGSFFSENVIDAGILQVNQTSWLSSLPSLDKPGTYHVRVHAYQCEFLADPEWSATATIVKAAAPPPPPPPTPKVSLVVRGWSGYDYTTGPLSKVRVGQRVVIELKASQSDRFAMRANGSFCTLTRQGNRCRAYGNAALTYLTARVSKNMVVREAHLHGAVPEPGESGARDGGQEDPQGRRAQRVAVSGDDWRVPRPSIVA